MVLHDEDTDKVGVPVVTWFARWHGGIFGQRHTVKTAARWAVLGKRM
jgi:hypothetical protein